MVGTKRCILKLLTLLMCVMCFLLCSDANAQIAVEVQGMGGIFSARRNNTPIQNVYGSAIKITKQTTGNKYWQQLHGYPKMGLSFSAYANGSYKTYGNQLALIPYLEFRIWKRSNMHMYMAHGTGIAYTSQHFHVTENPDNNLLSTHLNAASFVDAGMQIGAYGRNSIKTGILLSHISNGNFKQPNRGMNAVLLYVGVAMQHGKTPVYDRDTTFIPFKKWRYKVLFASGFYGYDAVQHTIQKNYQVAASVFYQHNGRFRTGAGIEVSDMLIGIPAKPAAIVTEEVLFGTIATQYGLGVYLLNDLPARYNRVYEKVGIAWYPKRYRDAITAGPFLGLAIKAHSLNGAHVEFNAGYAF